MLIKDVKQVTVEWLSEILKATVTDFTSEFPGEGHGTKKWRLSLQTSATPVHLFLKTSTLSHIWKKTIYKAIMSELNCHELLI